MSISIVHGINVTPEAVGGISERNDLPGMVNRQDITGQLQFAEPVLVGIANENYDFSRTLEHIRYELTLGSRILPSYCCVMCKSGLMSLDSSFFSDHSDNPQHDFNYQRILLALDVGMSLGFLAASSDLSPPELTESSSTVLHQHLLGATSEDLLKVGNESGACVQGCAHPGHIRIQKFFNSRFPEGTGARDATDERMGPSFRQLGFMLALSSLASIGERIRT